MIRIPEKEAGHKTGDKYNNMRIKDVTNFFTSRHIIVNTDVTKDNASKNINAQNA